MGRAPCCDKANVKKGPWSPEEDTKLKAYIEKYGTGNNWIALPQKIGLKRCGKSCRLRWLNYLRPNIKHGGFSEEEDNIICSLYISIGSRWSIIAAQLPGRTDNDIKNYWNTKLKKKLLGRRKQSNNNRLLSTGQDSKNGLEFDNSSCSPPQTLSNSAVERLQLHMQFQTLQNPNFSIYNNTPSLFPKLHPMQEKMIQNTRSNLMQQHLVPNGQPFFYSHVALDNNQQQDHLESSLNDVSPSESVMAFTNDDLYVPEGSTINQQFMNVAAFDTFLNDNHNINQDPVLGDFDCFKEVVVEDCGAEKDGMMWWPSNSNEYESKSGSMNSWDDSASVIQPEMFQDYALGYSM